MIPLSGLTKNAGSKTGVAKSILRFIDAHPRLSLIGVTSIPVGVGAIYTGKKISDLVYHPFQIHNELKKRDIMKSEGEDIRHIRSQFEQLNKTLNPIKDDNKQQLIIPPLR